MRYLNPKNDLTFKRVFGERKHLLQSFLNSILPFSEDQEIVDLEYLSPELVPDIPIKKNTTVDVRCQDSSGRRFIVEMQMLWTESFQQRVLFNASKVYVRQLHKSEDYGYLQPVYSVNLVDDIFDKSSAHYYHHYQIVNLANTQMQIKGLEFIFVELPKFQPKTRTEKKLRALWLRYLTEMGERGESNPPQELMENPFLREAVEYLQESSYSEPELEAYDKYWDIVRTERTLLGDAHRLGKVEGIAVGEAKGRAEGRAEGIAVGEARGEWIGKIQTLQELMGGPVLARELLLEKSSEELASLYAQLRTQWMKK